MNDERKIEVHERLASLETSVKTILDNHLPHIEKAVVSLGNKFWAVVILLIANLVALIIK